MNVATKRQHGIDLAHETRTGIAEFRRTAAALPPVEAARTVARAVKLDHQDRILGAARIGHLLKCVPRLGEGKVAKCLIFARVNDVRTRLRDLTVEQRELVVLQLELLAEMWANER